MALDFFKELSWRNMIHSTTPGVEEELAKGPKIAYIGFDPTAPSLTIGNLVQIMMLKLWQLSGHQPIVLMGGATGSIGDPSGKDKERQLKTREELDHNLQHQADQIKKYLDFEGVDNPAIIVNNYDFYSDMNILDFLRTVGKTLTVNYMMSKDSVKNRLETGLSFTEFSYQLLQAYDFQCLYQQYDCTFQIGGSDQWGNITAGTEFIRKNIQGDAFALTTPLLLKSDGTKFGKSAEGNIWLDPELTSPYKFYQFWLNISDEDLPSSWRYFTLKSEEETLLLESELKDNPRELKRIFAEEITSRIHGKQAFNSAYAATKLLFEKNADKSLLTSLDLESFKIMQAELPSFESEKQTCMVVELLVGESKVFSSNGELRRAIKNNALKINKTGISSHEHEINPSDWIHGKYILVENGKKNKFIVEHK